MIARLEFELAFYDVTFQQISSYVVETTPLGLEIKTF